MIFKVSAFVEILFPFESLVHDEGIVEHVEFEAFDVHFAYLADAVISIGTEALVVKRGRVAMRKVKRLITRHVVNLKRQRQLNARFENETFSNSSCPETFIKIPGKVFDFYSRIFICVNFSLLNNIKFV